MTPSRHKIHKPFASDIRIQPLNQLRPLRCDSPVAFSALAGPAEMTSEGYNRSRSYIACVGSERDCFDNVGGGTYTSADYERHVSAYSLVAQSLVNGRERKLYRYSDIVTDSRGRRSGSSAEAGDRYDIGSAPRNSARNRRDIVNRGNLDNYGLFIFGSLLKRVHKLTQILYRIYIVVRRRRNGVRSFGNHSCS